MTERTAEGDDVDEEEEEEEEEIVVADAARGWSTWVDTEDDELDGRGLAVRESPPRCD
jgi:hypothetical protein